MDLIKLLFALIFVFTGILHLVRPEIFLKIMPPWIPWHKAMVFISGLLEILFGCMLLIPSVSKIGAWGLIVVLIGVFPANIHMAVYSEKFSFVPAWILWARLPLQFVLIAWAYLYT
ncbi:MAG: DoxX family protein [Balneolaceae bacterium]|nr:DoxX family protein [Balneolaceae bacterium]